MTDIPIHLSTRAARVLGSLLEKETTTPEYYPLSLLALMNACNQRSSRQPVMELTEDEVRMALHELEDAALAAPVRGTESRVAKFAHHAGEVFNLRRGEMAVLCVLLLRGPQTPGELRSRTERLHGFATIDEVESSLQQLAQREPPLARAMPREPGAREVRYCHLLSLVTDATAREVGDREVRPAAGSFAGGAVDMSLDRIDQLESEVSELRSRVLALEDKLGQLLG